MALAHDSVHFIGGRGDGSGGVTRPGGCLKSWWDTECPNDTAVEKAAAMAKLMGATGAPIRTASGCAISDDNGYVKITDAGLASKAEVGMVVYCYFTATYTDGYYEITGVAATTFTLNLAYSTDVPTVEFWLGGAHDTYANAVTGANGIPDASWATGDRYIYFNLGYDTPKLVTNLSWVCIGVDGENAYVYAKGYANTPGDLAAGEYVELYNNTTANVLRFTTSLENVQIEHLYCHQSYGSSGYRALVWGDDQTFRNTIFNKCKFVSDSDVAIRETSTGSAYYNIQFNECTIMSFMDRVYMKYATDVNFLNCLIRPITLTATAYQHITIGSGSVKNCTILYGVAAVNMQSGVTTCRILDIWNNVCYGQSSRAVRINTDTGFVRFYNNIVVGNDVNTCGIERKYAGSFIEKNNCYWSLNGQLTSKILWDQPNDEEWPLDESSIEVDPRFKDPANGDFTVLNSKLLESGYDGGPMGAVLPTRRFSMTVAALAGSPITGGF